MSQNRHRSVPSGAGALISPASSQNSNQWSQAMAPPTVITSIAHLAAKSITNNQKAEGNKLLKQAEALASMHFELNLHSIASLAKRLEKDVQQLVLRTAEDHEFRNQNEERMTRMMFEVQSIKLFMQRKKTKQPVTRADIERLQHEMSKTTMEWNKQLDDAKAKIDEIEGRMTKAPRPPVAKAKEPEQSTPPTSRMETRAMRKAKVQLSSSTQKSSPSSSTPESRIKDAINSTKRWNREHKVTQMRENQFIVGYLKKQGQRDAELAKILHQALQKRASNLEPKGRRGKAKKQPSLEEICRHVSWQDVIATATEVLVVNKAQTLQLLG
ncbi:hypothetical protein F53441_10842 [Fusarium austroafricanum]|uniref:Uncharacterized protein n=1 Tax=Fusarium austroafricanum TaxID=2364996 RepID=A0A8H4K7X8_9HYPO|nr:hypothetical protein F53441_10842 [Fusarium austroafricanum]